MTFSGNQNYIRVHRLLNRPRYRGGAIFDDSCPFRMGESGNDVADNCIRIFAARIVIGDYDTISQMLCSAALPIWGRLPTSRSPPQPNTTQSRPRQ
jgi:hypothetical protein